MHIAKNTNIILLIIMVMGLLPTSSTWTMSKSTSKPNNTRVFLVYLGAATATAITVYTIYRYLHRKKNRDVLSFPPVTTMSTSSSSETTGATTLRKMTLADILPPDIISKPDPMLSEADSAHIFQISCRDTQGQIYTVDVHESYPIWYVKKLVAKQYIINHFTSTNTLYKITLIYSGKILEDDKELKEYGNILNSGGIVMAVIRPTTPPSVT